MQAAAVMPTGHCRTCNAPITVDVVSRTGGLCATHFMFQRWLTDFKAFCTEVYFPTVSPDFRDENGRVHLMPIQEQVADYIQDTTAQGKPVRMVIVKGRRVGASELICAYDTWYAIRTQNYRTIGIYAYRERTAKQLYQRKIWIAMLKHPWLNSFLYRQNNKTNKLLRTEMTLWNQTLLSIDTAAPESGRGFDNDLGHFTEAGQIPEPFYVAAGSSLLSGDGNVIFEGTPRDKGGTFYNVSKLDEYHQVRWPTIELNDEGLELLKKGRHHHLKPHHFIAIHAFNAGYEKVMVEIRKMSSLMVRREYLGDFISGMEYMYPEELYDPLTVVTPERIMSYGLYEDEQEMRREVARVNRMLQEIPEQHFEDEMSAEMSLVLHDIGRWSAMNKREMRNGIRPWEFVMGIDWGEADSTTVVVFARRIKDNLYQMVDVYEWSRIDYEEGYERVKHIWEKWRKAGKVILRPDASVMQGQAIGWLRSSAMNPIQGFDMSTLAIKKQVAEGLFTMMQTNHIHFYPDQPVRLGLLSVDWYVKSYDADRPKSRRHLNDYAAAILCAVHVFKAGTIAKKVTESKPVRPTDFFLKLRGG